MSAPSSEKLQEGTPRNPREGGGDYLSNKSVRLSFPGRFLSVCTFWWPRVGEWGGGLGGEGMLGLDRGCREQGGQVSKFGA